MSLCGNLYPLCSYAFPTFNSYLSLAEKLVKLLVIFLTNKMRIFIVHIYLMTDCQVRPSEPTANAPYWAEFPRYPCHRDTYVPNPRLGWIPKSIPCVGVPQADSIIELW